MHSTGCVRTCVCGDWIFGSLKRELCLLLFIVQGGAKIQSGAGMMKNPSSTMCRCPVPREFPYVQMADYTPE
jgi:hypothetical protein